jgi:glycosyltransferase involved in cell wall biosynthesis
MIKSDFPEVTFLEGPRKGLGANRNNALTRVTGTHILFIDDDVVIAPDFLTKTIRFLQEIGNDDAIVTGVQFENGNEIITPHKPNFLGFQSVNYKDGEALKSIVINSTVFPSSLFRRIHFDESIIYGYEELDIASQAIYHANCRIYYLPLVGNDHHPSKINRDFYAPFEDASRVFVTYKCYRMLQRRWIKAVSFLLIAYAHNFLASIKRRKARGLIQFWFTLKTSLKYIRQIERNKRASRITAIVSPRTN